MKGSGHSSRCKREQARQENEGREEGWLQEESGMLWGDLWKSTADDGFLAKVELEVLCSKPKQMLVRHRCFKSLVVACGDTAG